MKVGFDNPLKPREWALLAVWLLAAGLIYVLLIHPSWRLYTDLEQAEASKKEATEHLEQVRGQLERLQRQISESKKRLAEIGGPPPHEDQKDTQIACLTALAKRSGVTVDQYFPIDTIDNGDCRAFFIQFVGRGQFDAIRRFFASVESEMDFVDLTHFAVTASTTETSSLCSMAWSCQINGLRTDVHGASDPGKQQTPVEVALDAR